MLGLAPSSPKHRCFWYVFRTMCKFHVPIADAPSGSINGGMIPNPVMGTSGTSASISTLIGRTGRHGPQSSSDRQLMKQQILKQQRMLLFLRHCAKCSDPSCQYKDNCKVGKDLWQHIMACINPSCKHPRCVHSRELLRHYQSCQQDNCPICGPVKEFVKKNSQQTPNNGQHPQQGGLIQQSASGGSQHGVHRSRSGADASRMHPSAALAQHVKMDPGIMPHPSQSASRGATRPPPLPTEQPPLKRPNLGSNKALVRSHHLLCSEQGSIECWHNHHRARRCRNPDTGQSTILET